MTDERTFDSFDRIIGAIDGLPDVQKARPTTVPTVMPIFGLTQTYVVQTYKQEARPQAEFTVFLQVIDAQGGVRIAIPPKVMAAIYRQRDALVQAGRKRRARERWADLSPKERRERVAHLRPRADEK